MKKQAAVAAIALLVILSGCDGLGEDTYVPDSIFAGLKTDGTYTMYANGMFFDNDATKKFNGIMVWDYAELGENVNFTSTAGGGHAGSVSIEMKVVAADVQAWRSVAFYYSAGIPLCDVDYLSFWAKVPAGLPAVSLAAEFGRDPDDNAALLVSGNVMLIPADGLWHRRTVPVPRAARPNIIIKYLSITSSTPLSTVYIDDIEFCPFPAGGQIPADT